MTGFFDELTSKPSANTTDSAQDDTADVDALAPSDEAALNAEEDRTETRLRETTKALLKYGLLEAEQKPNLYRTATVQQEHINRILEPLDLVAQVDDIRGLVFLAIRLTAEEDTSDDDEWAHPLVRKQRLNLEQSLMVALLRQVFIAHEQESGTGAGAPLVAVDDLVPQLQLYLGETGSEQKDRTRVVNLLDQLKGHGLVTALDSHERVAIRPIITHLANPDNLSALLAALKERLATDQEAQ